VLVTASLGGTRCGSKVVPGVAEFAVFQPAGRIFGRSTSQPSPYFETAVVALTAAGLELCAEEPFSAVATRSWTHCQSFSPTARARALVFRADVIRGRVAAAQP